MATVKVYHYKQFNVVQSGYFKSQDMATRKVIESKKPHCEVIEESELEVDESTTHKGCFQTSLETKL